MISTGESADGRRQTPGPGAADPGEAGAIDLKSDEWQFLRATPDYDAEEMASVTLPAPRVGWGAAPAVAAHPVAPLAEFPEAETLVEILDDLLEAPRGARPGGPSAGPMWAAVPAAAEWTSLMGPPVERAGTAPAAERRDLPAPHDALLDALAAGERAGLLPPSDRRGG